MANPQIGAERLILLECLVPCAGLVIVPGVNPISRHIDREFVQKALRKIYLKIVLPAVVAEIERTVSVICANRYRNEVHGRKIALSYRIIDKPHAGGNGWISNTGCIAQILAVDLPIGEGAKG